MQKGDKYIVEEMVMGEYSKRVYVIKRVEIKGSQRLVYSEEVE